MNNFSHRPSVAKKKTAILLGIALLLAGCASLDFEQSIANTNQQAASFTQGNLALARNAEQRGEMAHLANQLLRQPLGQSDAVRLALLNSPALQAILAQNWANAARATQSGRIANPLFNFERMKSADELELSRLLSFGLLDLLTLPQRQNMAQQKIAEQQLRLTSSVIEHITQVRQAWVKAVAAQQSLVYAKQVNDAAHASSELARRLQAVGNFSKLHRARQQLFYAHASTQLASAQHDNTAAREALIRLLGLDENQFELLLLPDRLPDLPAQPRVPEEVSKAASQGRLDIQIAQAELQAQAKAQGLNSLTSLIDIELGVRRDTVFAPSAAANGETASSKRGYEISLRLPLFDIGENQRAVMDAQTLAAANRLEATLRAASSTLRENYSAYRTAFDVAKHYRDEVLSLRNTISKENILRYNGMLIGVFDLLADSQDQINSVLAAIAAEQQFWLADAALQASIIGQTSLLAGAARSSAAAASATGGAGH